jgi:dihydroorotase
MKLLIKQVTVADPRSSHNEQTVDLFFENGTLVSIGKNKQKADREIEGKGLFVSPGWVDIFANFADPGYEFKETLESGAAAAARGGFTEVIIVPNTNPVIHNKSGVEYIAQKTKGLPVTVHPAGAITKNTEGKELAEMYDMRASGAKAFTDGIHPVQSSGVLVKALQYVKAFDGIIIQLPDDKTINPQGLMNEGLISTRLGLPGKPALAEELLIDRDIKLAEYAEANLHFTGISTAESVRYVTEAKMKGIRVSCSVTPHHLYFSEEDLQEYDSNLKVDPPLRNKKDRDQLREAVRSGLIDCIASHHFPHEPDSKVLEFEYARPGMIALETAFAAVNTALGGIKPSQVAELFSIRPRELFGLEKISIAAGAPANFTFFNPDEIWTVDQAALRSRSRNSPFIGKELTGKVAGIVHRDHCTLDQKIK